MKKIIRIDQIPDNSIISEGFTRIDYFDTYRLTKNTNQSIEQIAKGIFNLPAWVNVYKKFDCKAIRIKNGKN